MKIPRSIGFRLTLWYALILGLSLSAFGVVIHWSLASRLKEEVAEELRDRAAAFERFVLAEAAEQPPVRLEDEIFEFCQALPASGWLEMRSADGFVRFRYPASGRPKGPFTAVRRQLTLRGEPVQVEVASSVASIARTLEILDTLLFSLMPIALLAASAGGAWLSRRALRPVAEMTAAARRISISNLSVRLDAQGSGDELENLAATWNTMLSRLESAVRTLSQFAADASHELRTPLAVIRTSAELALRRAREPEAYRESLAEIAAETERMTQLVEDLLFLARGDSGAVEIPRATMDLRPLLEEIVDEIGALATARGIALEAHLGSDAAPVTGNRAALRRLFLVLLDNALKFTPPGGRVTVALESRGAEQVAVVNDTGAGIAPEDVPHIFRRFYRADVNRSDSGHGLGLSLAASIATAHQATIQVESEPGSGSSFRIHFGESPVAEWQPEEPGVSGQPALSSRPATTSS